MSKGKKDNMAEKEKVDEEVEDKEKSKETKKEETQKEEPEKQESEEPEEQEISMKEVLDSIDALSTKVENFGEIIKSIQEEKSEDEEEKSNGLVGAIKEKISSIMNMDEVKKDDLAELKSLIDKLNEGKYPYPKPTKYPYPEKGTDIEKTVKALPSEKQQVVVDAVGMLSEIIDASSGDVWDTISEVMTEDEKEGISETKSEDSETEDNKEKIEKSEVEDDSEEELKIALKAKEDAIEGYQEKLEKLEKRLEKLEKTEDKPKTMLEENKDKDKDNKEHSSFSSGLVKKRGKIYKEH